MSYVIATKLSKIIEQKKFQIVICDEAHYLKSRDVRQLIYYNKFSYIELKIQISCPDHHESKALPAPFGHPDPGPSKRALQPPSDNPSGHILLLQGVRAPLLQPTRELLWHWLDRLGQYAWAPPDAWEVGKCFTLDNLSLPLPLDDDKKIKEWGADRAACQAKAEDCCAHWPTLH